MTAPRESPGAASELRRVGGSAAPRLQEPTPPGSHGDACVQLRIDHDVRIRVITSALRDDVADHADELLRQMYVGPDEVTILLTYAACRGAVGTNPSEDGVWQLYTRLAPPVAESNVLWLHVAPRQSASWVVGYPQTPRLQCTLLQAPAVNAPAPLSMEAE